MTAQTLDKLSKHNKSATANCRGHKNILEFVYIKYSIFKKMPTTKDKLHTYKVTVIIFIDFVFVLFKWSCTYLELEILPCMPTAELCATSTDNSTTFGILQLRTPYGNQQFSQGAQRAFSKYHIYIYMAVLLQNKE